MIGSSRYRFERSVHVPLAPGDVFDALLDTHDWPRWWRHLEAVEPVGPVEPGGSDGPVEPVEPDHPPEPAEPHPYPTRGVQRFTVTAPMGYRIEVLGRFARIDPPRLLEAELAGDLVGSGRLLLRPAPGATTDIDYELDVRVTKTWMRVLAPVARRAFEANHHRVFDEAIAGLIRRVDP